MRMESPAVCSVRSDGGGGGGPSLSSFPLLALQRRVSVSPGTAGGGAPRLLGRLGSFTVVCARRRAVGWCPGCRGLSALLAAVEERKRRRREGGDGLRSTRRTRIKRERETRVHPLALVVSLTLNIVYVL